MPVATTELGKLVLHNTTKGEEAYIEDVNIGANDIQITDVADTVGWEKGDVLQVRSLTNTQTLGGARFFDVYLDSTEIPALAVAMHVNWIIENAGASATFYHHPFEAYNAFKLWHPHTQVAGVDHGAFSPVQIVNRRFTVGWDATGPNSASNEFLLFAVILATP